MWGGGGGGGSVVACRKTVSITMACNRCIMLLCVSVIINKICIVCVRVIINNRSFEPFCVWIWLWNTSSHSVPDCFCFCFCFSFSVDITFKAVSLDASFERSADGFALSQMKT